MLRLMITLKRFPLMVAFSLAVMCGQNFAAPAAEARQGKPHHSVAAKAHSHGHHAHAKTHAKAKAAPQAPLTDAEWAVIQERFRRWLPQFRQKALDAHI